MKTFITILFFLISNNLLAQEISIRLVQTSYNNSDPDGVGPATGSVTIQFELMSSTIPVLADGIGLSFVYQSALLIPTPTNTTTPQGPIVTSPGWSQNVDNRLGTDVNVVYGGQTFNKRMIITFQQSAGIQNAPVTNSWTPIAQVTYWTTGNTQPQGGFATPEPGSILPQNSLSSDGGLTVYDYLSPNLNSPLALGSAVTPVQFTKFVINCSDKGTVLNWATGTEINSAYFEVQRSTNGTEWTQVGKENAAGNSSTTKSYQLMDISGGTAYYRIRQVDLDGKFIYTNVIRSDCDNKNIGIVIYPVPARDVLNIVIRADKAISTQLIIFDNTGKMVRRMNASIVTGSNTLNFNLKGLPSGEYMIRSSDPAIDLKKKFTILQ
ncbi:MAG: T9SS type A sorting domain-containing protein [Ferruginibacter sp.]